MTIISNVVKVTNQMSYANDPSGVPQGECQTSEIFVYDGNVYPIYQQQIWVPALPNNSTLAVNHYITDFPSDPKLPIWLFGMAHEVGPIDRNLDSYGTTLSWGISNTQVIIITTDDKSNTSARITIKYVKQNDFTSVNKF